MNDVLFAFKQAIGFTLLTLCSVVIGISTFMLCKYVDELFEILRKRG